MTTFFAVLGGIVTANVIWTAVMFALFASKKVRTMVIKWSIDYTKESMELIEEEL